LSFVLDNSITMRWCFEDNSPYAEQVLDQMLAGEQAPVPVLWLYEVISVMAAAELTGILSHQRAQDFFDDLRALEIEIDPQTEKEYLFHDAHSLALKHRLTGYDAAYLELALRKQIPMASLDGPLNKAAAAAGVVLLKP